MKPLVDLGVLDWKKPKFPPVTSGEKRRVLITADGSFALQACTEEYFATKQTFKEFQKVDVEKPNAIRDFLERYGPLTRDKRDSETPTVTPAEFKAWRIEVDDARADGIELVGEPGERERLIFKPRALIDYFRLLRLEQFLEQDTRECAYPGCKETVGDKRSDQIVCKAHRHKWQNWKRAFLKDLYPDKSERKARMKRERVIKAQPPKAKAKRQRRKKG